MAEVLISLGSNLGQRLSIIEQAVALLAANPALDVRCHSHWLETPPVGGPAGQSPFLNGALLAETDLSPRELLQTLLQVEGELGRQRKERWGARTIDLDILLYDRLVVCEPDLRVPHPRMAFRYFNLAPAAEIAGHLIHPEIGWTIEQLLSHLYDSDPYIAITGPLGAMPGNLLQQLADSQSVELILDPRSLADQARLAADLSGPQPSSAIEFNVPRAEALRRDRFDLAGGKLPRMTLSDFWLGETKGDAETDAAKSSEPTQGGLSAGIAPSRQESLQPRLVVLLDVSWRHAREQLESMQIEIEESSWQEYRKRVVQAVGRPGHGPVLTLDAHQPELALAELSAAIEAILPPD